MAKKSLLVLVLVVIVTTVAFAGPEFKLSLGAGGYFASDFGGGAEWESGSWRIAYETPYAGGGGFLFLDATFVELSFGFFTGSGTMRSVADIGALGSYSLEAGYSLTGLDIGLMGKYPFIISPKFSIFPLLGINYRTILNLKDEDGNESNEPGDLSVLWMKLGGGLDYFFSDNIFLRFGVSYGIRLPNQYDEEMSDFLKEYIDAQGISNPDSSGPSWGPRLGHGLEVKLAVGFSF